MKNEARDYESVDAALVSQPKSYNTRAASRRALADVFNLARPSNVGKGSNLPTYVKNHSGHAARSISTQPAIIEPAVSECANIKHEIEDTIAGEAYATSLKLPVGVVDIDSQDLFDHLTESSPAVSIHLAQIDRELASIPKLEDFVYIADKTYTSAEILRMEAHVCSLLNFVFTVPKSLQFATRGLKAFFTVHPNADRRITEFSHYALELELCANGMAKYRPSMIAASAIAFGAVKLAYVEMSWIATTCFHTGGYTLGTLGDCAEDLWALMERDCDEFTHQRRAVRRKYSSDKFNQVALIFPAFNSEQLSSIWQDAIDVDNQHRE